MADLQTGFTRALERLGIPILSVRFPTISDRATWVIQYGPSATQPQKDQAEALKLTYDLASDTAIVDEEADRLVEMAKVAYAFAVATAKLVLGRNPTALERQTLKADAKSFWKTLP